jgi:hypothetical protein
MMSCLDKVCLFDLVSGSCLWALASVFLPRPSWRHLTWVNYFLPSKRTKEHSDQKIIDSVVFATHS